MRQDVGVEQLAATAGPAAAAESLCHGWTPTAVSSNQSGADMFIAGH